MDYKDAGADFCKPGIRQSSRICTATSSVYAPGCMTPTEIITRGECRLEIYKIVSR